MSNPAYFGNLTWNASENADDLLLISGGIIRYRVTDPGNPKRARDEAFRRAWMTIRHGYNVTVEDYPEPSEEDGEGGH